MLNESRAPRQGSSIYFYRMASPPATVLLLLAVALLASAPRPTRSSADPGGGFREEEYTATVSRTSASNHHALLPPHDKAAVARLLAAARNRTMRSPMCRGGGGARTTTGTTAAGGRLVILGRTRCAEGVSCADCGRCLRGVLAVFEREYNGSAGMQVLRRLSCVASYETYPLYKSTSRRLLALAEAAAASENHEVKAPTIDVNIGSGSPSPASPSTTTSRRNHAAPASTQMTQPASPPSAGRVPPPSPPASAQPIQAPPADHMPPPSPPTATPVPLAPTPRAEAEHGSWRSRKRLIITLTVSIATGVAVVVVVILAGIWFHRKHKVHMGHVADDIRGESMYDDRGEDHSSMEEEEEVEGERTSCQLYSYQALEAATCQFSSSNKLGSGGFGTVYKGTLGNGKEVAVKRLRDSKKNIQELEREISMVANLHHKNLVRFLGHCFQEEGRFLVYEYVPNNSLEKFWYKASFQCQKLDWAAWHNIIIGVARGLQFLHNKGIIHRDLKPHNVLLDEHFNPKIADFDLMRVYDKQKTHESTEKAAGTLGYMAPECTSGRKFLLSIKSDVYSYGVLVLEIITGHKIYTFEGQNSEGLVEYVWQHWREKRVSGVVDDDLLAGVEEEGRQGHALRQALRCVHVALLCVQADRSRRPAMGQVIAMLRREEMELQEPSLPGYVARPTTVASGVPLPCLGCR